MNRALTADELSTFRRKGYVTLRQVFDADLVAHWDAECKRLLRLGVAHENNLRTHPYYVTETLWVVDRMDPVIDISDVFKKLSTHELVLGVVRQIFEDNALLFKDRLIYKMLGVRGYQIHQDYSWWQEFPEDLVNVAIAIDGADAENGALELFPGHHKLLSTAGEMRHMTDAEAEQIDFSSGELMITEPGDMVIFHCMTPHRSGPNLSNRLRRQLYFTYSAARHGDLYERQIELMKEGKSSRHLDENRKAQLFLR